MMEASDHSRFLNCINKLMFYLTEYSALDMFVCVDIYIHLHLKKRMLCE